MLARCLNPSAPCACCCLSCMFYPTFPLSLISPISSFLLPPFSFLLPPPFPLSPQALIPQTGRVFCRARRGRGNGSRLGPRTGIQQFGRVPRQHTRPTAIFRVPWQRPQKNATKLFIPQRCQWEECQLAVTGLGVRTYEHVPYVSRRYSSCDCLTSISMTQDTMLVHRFCYLY